MKSRILIALILTAALLPVLYLWKAEYLPLIDYPNCLARVKIMKSIGTVPFYSGYFTTKFFSGPFPIPDIIFDLFATKLLFFLPGDTAGRIFLTLYVLLSIGSVLLLARETEADEELVLLAYLPVLYGLFFNMGLMNYMFSIPLVFLAMASLTRFGKQGKLSYLAIFLCLCMLVYISHLFSFFILLLFVILYLPGSDIKMKRIIFSVAAVFIFIAFIYIDRADLSMRWHPIGARYKLFIMPLYFLSYPVNYLDAVSGTMVLVFYGIGVISMFVIGRVERKRFLAAAGVLFAFYLILPFSGAGGSLVDVRVLPYALMLLVVSLGKAGKDRRVVPVIFFCIALAVKAYGSFSYYSAFEKEFPLSMSCMERVEKGSTVLPVVANSDTNINPYGNSWGYLFVRKEIMVPYVFAGRHQPVKYSRELFAPSGLWGYNKEYKEPPDFWEKLQKTYDYIIVYGDNKNLERAVSGFSSEICRTDKVSLFRVTGGRK
jgi:hypothetical protein